MLRTVLSRALLLRRRDTVFHHVMKTSARPEPPSITELKTALGPAWQMWRMLIDEMAEAFPPLEEVWTPSTQPFGHVCRLKQKKRTLLYLIPGGSRFDVAAVLGTRAFALAMTSELPTFIKQLLSDARPYAEGRGIRFTIASVDQVRVVRQLVAIKITPN